jgi:2-polyprenyl-6-methoxyphenol hydroxylase-like FAD-dependent oxidoreductase
MHQVLRAAGCDPSRDFGVAIAGRKVLDRAGHVIGRRAYPQTSTSWDRVFRMLREVFPVGCYHLGKELRQVDVRSDSVLAHFADGSSAEGAVLIGADGVRSTVRTQVLPSLRQHYAGYVAWRGLVAEAELSAAAHADLFDALAFALPPGEQFLSYPVAGPTTICGRAIVVAISSGTDRLPRRPTSRACSPMRAGTSTHLAFRRRSCARRSFSTCAPRPGGSCPRRWRSWCI